MIINTDNQKIHDLLTRGVENVYPNREFLEKRLKSGERLTLYLGIDPTGPDLHLGHAISMMKLCHFQELGHKVILLIGSFTAMIGDPTDKSATRQPLTRKQVLENAKKYKDQAAKILDFKGQNKVEVKYNSKWFDKMNFKEVVELASNFTVQQMLERDMFDKRIKDGKPIGLHEFLYPLMQGYDSVAMDVDGEVGGNDQTFNMLAGRDLMKSMDKKEKFVVTNKLLVDSIGTKMGKTEGNMITLSDEPNDMFGKVMSWTDGMIVAGFELCTTVPIEKVKEVETQIESDVNPRDLKVKLAKEIVKFYFDEETANAAEENFVNTFKNKQQPDEIEVKIITNRNIVDALVESGLVGSKSDARRQIEQNAVKVNDIPVDRVSLEVSDGDVIQKGKRHFARIAFEK
ncbi:tyrosine--tRNA ligase [Candidatus Falkowbacteria bacterium CG10_big_fil_rev_8_21_14_0_10_39_11]|uniref:Tyrosine--tRNA ligase n=1 Tax=Candidatus Falkowbacteria bacterium CG10_big_fil_rev_8_21_14_0_10_39_11 TaxID=1974565 RepID=A0A2H0V6A5_9BACT|nr:MAG: tyrosine--tRNA ligase [Candidatus Falkowbacteria bacterium CG10_big_fil_rev_8_21_14_0_10_39_11]